MEDELVNIFLWCLVCCCVWFLGWGVELWELVGGVVCFCCVVDVGVSGCGGWWLMVGLVGCVGLSGV